MYILVTLLDIIKLIRENMGIYARPVLDNLQFKQSINNVLDLSGQTRISTTSGFTLTNGNGNDVVLTATDNEKPGTNGQILMFQNGKIQLSSPPESVDKKVFDIQLSTLISGIGGRGYLSRFVGDNVSRELNGSTIYQDISGNVGIHTENVGNFALNVNGDVKVKQLNTKNIKSDGALEIDAMGYNVIISTSGNIGVGKFNPQYKLDVTGRIRATDTSYFNYGFVADANSAINGNLGINTLEPTTRLDINSNKIRIRESKTPESENASGNKGDWCWDDKYFYICIEDNKWKKVELLKW